MEVSSPKLRSVAGVMLIVPWSMGMVAWGGLAYLLREWRMLQLTVSLTCFIFLPVLLFIDESPRWLAVQGRHQQAIKVLQKAARWNNISLPPEQQLLDCLAGEGENTRRVEGNRRKNTSTSMILAIKNLLAEATILFRTPRLRHITLSCYFTFFVVAMVYFGLSLSGGNYTSDPFTYMALSGAVEMTVIPAIPLIIRVGRKTLAILSFLLTGVALLALSAIPSDIEWLIVTVAMIGKLSINFAFNVIMLLASELFPTEVRIRGLGTSFMVSRLGAIVAPVVTDYLVLIHAWLPSVVFGVASVVAGLVTFTLPETLNVTLLDTVSELEAPLINTHQDRKVHDHQIDSAEPMPGSNYLLEKNDRLIIATEPTQL
nr:organic cation transporter protein-like [Cherax quadricarinatus]